jgi:hypothetical protein
MEWSARFALLKHDDYTKHVVCAILVAVSLNQFSMREHIHEHVPNEGTL